MNDKITESAIELLEKQGLTTSMLPILPVQFQRDVG